MPSPPPSSTPTPPLQSITSLPNPTPPPRPILILLINPNSTPTMTTTCLTSLTPTLPPSTTIHGFTAPSPSPTAIESRSDAVLSTATCLRAILPLARENNYDAYLIACFSAHPLIAVLREELPHAPPVIGIMEAALYAARMLGGRFGIVATGARSKVMHEDAVRGDYGLEGFCVGVEVTGLGVLELETKSREEVLGKVGSAAGNLVREKGADCVALGCAGMTDMRERCVEEVGGEGVTVLDGVGIGVQFLVGMVREGLRTGKGGVYRSAEAGRKARGQVRV